MHFITLSVDLYEINPVKPISPHVIIKCYYWNGRLQNLADPITDFIPRISPRLQY